MLPPTPAQTVAAQRDNAANASNSAIRRKQLLIKFE
jgi:hypothetical protein